MDWLTKRWLPGLPLGNELRGAIQALFVPVSFLFLLLFLRFSPISGTHGAEHMVVHAMEEGEDLTMEKVRPMPRVHPRLRNELGGAAGSD